jgi:hypothetical protein
MKTAVEKLQVCKVCLKRTFESSKGIVCSLTNEKPNFVNDCDDYDVDEIANNKMNSKGMPSIYKGITEGVKNETEDMSKGRVAFNLLRFIISFFR